MNIQRSSIRVAYKIDPYYVVQSDSFYRDSWQEWIVFFYFTCNVMLKLHFLLI
jgi:hypothetical protein